MELNVEGNFKEGSPQGAWTISQDGGRQLELVTFKNGLRDGEAKAWHGNGSLASVGNYKAGAETGTWMRWSRLGKLVDVTCYDGGARQWTNWRDLAPCTNNTSRGCSLQAPHFYRLSS